MKTIKVAFTDFWQEFDKNDNFILDILRKRHSVIVLDADNDDTVRRDVQYVFYSCFSRNYLKYDCIRIFYTAENICPDFNLCDYAIGFDYITFGDRYIRYPYYMITGRDDLKLLLSKHRNIDESFYNRKFCSMVVSNIKNASNMRKCFFEALSEYQKVDSGGRYLNNIGQPQGVEDKLVFQQQYKFSLTFENSSHLGYCTEKILQGFAAQTVPIYWGDPTVAKQFNEKAFVNCHKFSTVQDIVDEIIAINEDKKRYMDMLVTPAITGEAVTGLKEQVEGWLYHIFEQDYDKAFRRNLYGRCVLYEQEWNQYIELTEAEKRRNATVFNRGLRKLRRISEKVVGKRK